jgi:hypothetical protein
MEVALDMKPLTKQFSFVKITLYPNSAFSLEA